MMAELGPLASEQCWASNPVAPAGRIATQNQTSISLHTTSSCRQAKQAASERARPWPRPALAAVLENHLASACSRCVALRDQASVSFTTIESSEQSCAKSRGCEQEMPSTCD